MEPENLACFSQPHWKVIAQGFKPEPWFEHNHAKGTGGMLRPQHEYLRVGNRYFRFANGTASRDAQVGGGWWLDFENFKIIEQFARNSGVTLAYAARLFLAIPYDWSRVDRLVSAFLSVPLCAYSGYGQVAIASDETWTPPQHIKVRQLYIPGLYKKGQQPQLYERAFPSPVFECVANR